jgi:hypothetical protein
MYNCVATPSGLTTMLTETMDADGTCHVGGITLRCGGTGTLANGMPATWAAGNNLGPSGGAGLVIQGNGLQLNCE